MIGQIISHYKIIEKLGEGGMGVVCKAEDIKLKRTVALKFLPPELTRDESAKERFIHEAQAASALQHNNICNIHDIDQTADGQLYIVMDCYEGELLKEKIVRESIKLEETVDVAVQVASGLSQAHEKGIVHRDIKPANIFITTDGTVKILDFGLAKLAGGQTKLTKAGSTLGTVAYMSPEQARGEDVDQRTDIWSLGVVLYEMLTGKLPFKGDYEQATIYCILNESPKSIITMRSDIPEILSKIVDTALKKDCSLRYQSIHQLLMDLRSFKENLHPTGTEFPPTLSIGKRIKQPKIWIPALTIVIILVILISRWIERVSNIRWARDKTLSQIENAIQDGCSAHGLNAWTAYELAAKAENYIPDDQLFRRLIPRFSRKVHILSTPAGASVYAKPYSDPESEWRHFGRTPIDSIRFPLGLSRIKIEKTEYRTTYDLVWNSNWFSDTLLYQLVEEESIPEGMEFVPDSVHWYEVVAAPAGLHMPGLEHIEAGDVGRFLMDRYEVKNKDYKRFIDSGGYQNRTYWKYPFIMNNRQLSWDEGIKLLIDKTGQPGPSTWEVGDYPPGMDEYPVTGVSWYESAAYAEFIGKSLPTIYHWDRVAFTWASPVIIPLSNLGGDKPKPVGSSFSMNRFGIHDLSGNVREWCFNKSGRMGNFILGGGWNDPTYAFNDAYAQQPFDRSETNGFRCIKYIDSKEKRATLERVIMLPYRDFLNESIASDKDFAIYLKQFAYDKSPLNATIELVKEEDEWVREKISFNAAYGEERIIAYLFLPRKGTPPYQTIIYFPGSSAIHDRSSESLSGNTSLLKSGRAFMYPIYKSTYERGDNLRSDYQDETNFWKEHVIMWVKDLSRSIDYLETRSEIDQTKIAYYGASWGGAMGGIIPAVEKRIKVSVLLVAGLGFQRTLPEVDPLHFLPHIQSPVLMLNGKYDFFFPYETSQRPFFELLGTPTEDKKIIVYEGGHSVPPIQMVKETLAWLDRYLGPVK